MGFSMSPFLYLYQLPLLLSIPLVMGVKLNWSTGEVASVFLCDLPIVDWSSAECAIVNVVKLVNWGLVNWGL
jgi:hypothetical protein